ncbi:RNA polymerase sigma factor [soil metagenome]
MADDFTSAAAAVAPDATISPAPENDRARAEDSALAARLKRADESAYEELVRRFGPRMLAVARRMLRSDADADDAVQQAFISAFKAIDRFEGGSLLSTWLHRITVNAALMKLRSQGRLREGSLDGLLPTFSEDGHRRGAHRAPESHAALHASGEETRTLVMQQIDRLPEAYRAVLVMRDIDQLSTAQSAALLNTTETAVKVRLHRARQALRELLEPLMQEGVL